MQYKKTILFSLFFILLSLQLNAQTTLQVLDPQVMWNQKPGSIEEATYSVSPRGLYSQVSLYLTFSAKGVSFPTSSQLEVVLNFDLPDGSFVSDLWLWIGDKISRGAIMDTWKASSIYEGIVNRRRDPALLRKFGTNHYELRVYPMEPLGTRKVRITYFVPNNWSSTNISIPLPLNIIRASYTKVSKLTLITWENDEWKNPRLAEFTAGFENYTDDFFGTHKKVVLNTSQTIAAATVNFDNPMLNGVFLKFYKKTGTEGFYQLSLFPGYTLQSVGKKTLFLIDNDSRKSSFDRDQVLASIKNLLLNSYSSADQFNIFFSGLSIKKLSDGWLKADKQTVEDVFKTLSANSISVYSNLTTLLKEGYEYAVQASTGTEIFLVANSDQVGSYQTANQLIADIKSIMTKNIPTYILDYNDREFTYYYFNNRSYRGNEYFYDNLARVTAGAYVYVGSDLYTSLQNLNSKSGAIISSFDLYTTLDYGFCFSRYNLGSQQSYSLSQAIAQVGKFIGNFPFIIKTSGLYNSTAFTHTRIVEQYNASEADSTTEKMWTSSYINSLLKGQLTNSVINEVIQLSIENRILTDYTAFLSVEDDSAFCSDCYKDDGQPTVDADDPEVLPTEFSLTAYPNPFNPQVTITIQIPQHMIDERLTFKIYNILGEVVKTFDVSDYSGGVVKLTWNGLNDFGENVATGVYIFTVSGAKFTRSIKLMYMK